jgi:hypothetical protein
MTVRPMRPLHLVFTTFVLGCSSSDPPPSSQDDSGVEVAPVACTPGSDTCGPAGYCAATACDAMGTCKPRPPESAGASYGSICGCTDGITYWSADWAAHLGVIGVGGACDGPSLGKHAPAKTCTTDADCVVPGARCLASGCDPTAKKSCWSVPPTTTCPMAAMPLRGWETCDKSAKCLTECEALQTGKPFDTSAICP